MISYFAWHLSLSLHVCFDRTSNITLIEIWNNCVIVDLQHHGSY
jgi:hypothetical protein